MTALDPWTEADLELRFRPMCWAIATETSLERER